MPVLVRIPSPLRNLTQGEAEIRVEGCTVGEVLQNLDGRYAGLKERLLDESGQVRRFINIFVNEEDIRFLNRLQTPLKEGDVVSIIPAIAGGLPAGKNERTALKNRFWQSARP